MAEVVLEGVSKSFPGNVQAVRDFSLTIADRELVVLVGPSGCGKTTTLRMVAGLEEISDGTVMIGGRVVNHIPPKDRDIAMVFQNYALYPVKTVYENMAFGLRMKGYRQEEIEARVTEAARILGITELLDRRPKALSGGQRQRVAVGRAIVRKPAVFLFDEPLSNLDAKLRVEMRAELNRLHRSLETTMIYVTHDQVEAMTLGDRIVVMHQGRIQQVGEPLEIYDRPINTFVGGFVGTPPMNFLGGELVDVNGGFTFREGAADIPVPARLRDSLTGFLGQKLMLGIRPEDILDRPQAGLRETAGMRVKVDVVEPLGDDTLLYLSTPTHQFIAKVPSHEGVVVGKTLEVTLNLSKVHFFDPRTGMNLCLDSVGRN